jgi:hypothetical protein
MSSEAVYGNSAMFIINTTLFASNFSPLKQTINMKEKENHLIVFSGDTVTTGANTF